MPNNIDDLELAKFIKAISLVKVDVHHYHRVTFTYNGDGTVATRTDYAEDKTTIIRTFTYTYVDGNVTEIDMTEP